MRVGSPTANIIQVSIPYVLPLGYYKLYTECAMKNNKSRGLKNKKGKIILHTEGWLNYNTKLKAIQDPFYKKKV